MPGRPTRCVTSARSRPLSTAIGQRAANFCSASKAPGASQAASGSSTMSDSVPSKSKNTAGCRATRPSARPSACNASGSCDMRRSPVRTLTSLRSVTTVSAPSRRNASRHPVRSTPMISANPLSRAAVTPAEWAETTTHRPGRTARRPAATIGTSRPLPKTPVPTPTSWSCRTSSWVASNVVSNSTASWRRGSMVTGPNLRTTHPLTGVNADGDGVSDALGRSAQRAAPAARRWGVRGMNAYADPW
ncbi:Uncharacterised protein [Mycobacterium tuberculosis]|uniref:Uncharacterized protein n=2 Tax=Mycobacterium tuberculosis TaxID=1773 RepID=A0A654ZGV5_MYCTX|nr:Uncharacterised protein [Mycobacterium tuberculosis]CKP23405.1 Uncharacterised protein [Mycobacterium tuberculosis]CKR58915.1 Uncharacterised protein [Mycobacterium tuberculosis]CKS94760.1 Uncharacterised protein [Mycobacterium tuberculosis]CNM53495.1 Uncharacterised protein [Mycobacterium tuberculosis]